LARASFEVALLDAMGANARATDVFRRLLFGAIAVHTERDMPGTDS
jgi:hypothetical protein